GANGSVRSRFHSHRPRFRGRGAIPRPSTSQKTRGVALPVGLLPDLGADFGLPSDRLIRCVRLTKISDRNEFGFPRPDRRDQLISEPPWSAQGGGWISKAKGDFDVQVAGRPHRSGHRSKQGNRAWDCPPLGGSRLFCTGGSPQYSRNRGRGKRDYASGGQG